MRDKFLRVEDMKKDDKNNDHSDPSFESLKKAVQKCRENRECLMRQKALQRGFLEEEPQKRMGISDDEEKERIRRRNIGLIVQLEWEKLEMEKKRRTGQIGVGHEEEEEELRKTETSPRFQDSNNSKIGVEDSGRKRRRCMGVKVLQIPAK